MQTAVCRVEDNLYFKFDEKCFRLQIIISHINVKRSQQTNINTGILHLVLN